MSMPCAAFESDTCSGQVSWQQVCALGRVRTERARLLLQTGSGRLVYCPNGPVDCEAKRHGHVDAIGSRGRAHCAHSEPVPCTFHLKGRVAAYTMSAGCMAVSVLEASAFMAS